MLISGGWISLVTQALCSNSSLVEYRAIVGGRNFKNLLMLISGGWISLVTQALSSNSSLVEYEAIVGGRN